MNTRSLVLPLSFLMTLGAGGCADDDQPGAESEAEAEAEAESESEDTWTATSTTGAPAPRDYHTAVWTGSELIVWGGLSGEPGGGGTYVDTGGRYTP
ncbi:MAG: hypothetical protein AABZ30_07410 [Myxococcota bacterium]